MGKEIWMMTDHQVESYCSYDVTFSDLNECAIESQRKILKYLITQEVKLPLVGGKELQIVDIRLIKDMLKQLETK